jgi:hypothetical protein
MCEKPGICHVEAQPRAIKAQYKGTFEEFQYTLVKYSNTSRNSSELGSDSSRKTLGVSVVASRSRQERPLMRVSMIMEMIFTSVKLVVPAAGTIASTLKARAYPLNKSISVPHTVERSYSSRTLYRSWLDDEYGMANRKQRLHPYQRSSVRHRRFRKQYAVLHGV